MLTALEVARFFLADTSEEEPDSITNMKLQKLLYYAQGYSLVLLGEAIFSDKIKRWNHGPVVTEVYHEYKSYGKKPIPRITVDFNCFTKVHLLVLNKVIAEKGKYCAFTLSEMTHNESPWKDTMPNHEMTVKKLQEYFSKRVKTPYSFNLKKMKEAVEEQNFVAVPASVMDNDNDFNDWVMSIAQ